MTGASVHGLGRGLRLFGGVPFAVSRIFATFIDESKTPLQMKRLFLLFFCFLFAGAVHAADYRFERDILYRTDASGDYARRMVPPRRGLPSPMRRMRRWWCGSTAGGLTAASAPCRRD